MSSSEAASLGRMINLCDLWVCRFFQERSPQVFPQKLQLFQAVSYTCELTQALNKLQSLWNHTTAALRTACQAYLHFSLCTQSLYIRQSSPGLGSGRRPHHCQTIFKCKNTQPEPQATSLPFVFLDSGVTWTHSQPMDWSIHGRC